MTPGRIVAPLLTLAACLAICVAVGQLGHPRGTVAWDLRYVFERRGAGARGMDEEHRRNDRRAAGFGAAADPGRPTTARRATGIESCGGGGGRRVLRA